MPATSPLFLQNSTTTTIHHTSPTHLKNNSSITHNPSSIMMSSFFGGSSLPSRHPKSNSRQSPSTPTTTTATPPADPVYPDEDDIIDGLDLNEMDLRGYQGRDSRAESRGRPQTRTREKEIEREVVGTPVGFVPSETASTFGGTTAASETVPSTPGRKKQRRNRKRGKKNGNGGNNNNNTTQQPQKKQTSPHKNQRQPTEPISHPRITEVLEDEEDDNDTSSIGSSGITESIGSGDDDSNIGDNNGKKKMITGTLDLTNAINGAMTTRKNGKNRKKNRGNNHKCDGKVEKQPVKLQLGLNLKLNLELKAEIEGDITISLVAESTPAPRRSPEIPLDPDYTGRSTFHNLAHELFFVRVGTVRFYQQWQDQQVSPVLTGGVMVSLLFVGFLVGFLARGAVEMARMGYEGRHLVMPLGVF